ncbi:aminotransferase class IV [Candidatus Oleimmundimicrobium sp.]|uniref:aminotransferase class IV n=1 Tax=Candidatus Oleimmundimicrobium sp. TaxID=3060597 RepID=UPI0027241545|nr:aminotransferase class IV [Candidatus Oleimmundimicrobium sp.]MDO8885491.1 aminotransferase class IV [Candidatus Oleimmundimicrobium sp.]
MNEDIVFLNGEFIPGHLAKISIFDRGFLFGDGLFETMRAYNGKIFRLDAHLKRLLKSLDIIQIKHPYSQSYLEQALYETIGKNKLSDAYVKLIVTRGTDTGSLIPSPDSKSTILIIAKKFDMYSPEQYEEGFKVMMSDFRQNQFSSIINLKSLNFLENIIGKLEAKQSGADEIIFINQSGFVTEGSVSNIFIVCNDVIMTPPCEVGILPGIARETIFELAESLNLKIIEKNFYLEELLSCSECFLTNSLMRIMPVTQIEDKIIENFSDSRGDRWGKLTRLLMKAYQDLVDNETL